MTDSTIRQPPGKVGPPKRPPPKMIRPPPKLDIQGAKKAVEGSKKATTVLGRKLHWDALQGNKIQGTVFQELTAEVALAEDLSNLIDPSQLRRIFAQSKEKAGGKHRMSIAAGEGPPKRQLLAGNRAQNIAIILSRLPISIEDIASSLINMDSERLDRELLTKLVELVPTDDEVRQYQTFIEHNEPFESLRDIEKKFFPLFKVKKMRQRCQILSSAKQIPELHTDIKDMLNLLYKGGSEVRKSKRFRAFLVAVLLWGNFVNHGVDEDEAQTVPSPQPKEEEATDKFGRRKRKAGTAALEIRTFGFTLSSLLKLADFKTTIDPSITSLHFIVANMIQSQPKVELHLMCEEMPSIGSASKIQASALKEALGNLQQEITFLKQECEYKNVADIYGNAVEPIKKLYEDGKQILEEITLHYDHVTSFVGETAAYFGDQKAKTKPESHEEFFKVLHQFLQKFQQCVSDYLQNTKKFKDVMVESAQNRGLTYTQDNSADKQQPTVKKQGTKKEAKKINPKDLSTAAAAVVTEVGTIVHNEMDELAQKSGSILDAPKFKRATQRRASVGGISQGNILLPKRPVLPPPTASKEQQQQPPTATVSLTIEQISTTTSKPSSAVVNTQQVLKKDLPLPQQAFKRHTTRRSTAGGMLYGLDPTTTIPSIKKPILEPSASSKLDNENNDHTTTKKLHPTLLSAQNNFVSDTELSERKMNNYVIKGPEATAVESEPEDRAYYKPKPDKKGLKLKSREDSVCDEVKTLIYKLSVSEALDAAIEEYMRFESKNSEIQ